jgi:hypothetical protein
MRKQKRENRKQKNRKQKNRKQEIENRNIQCILVMELSSGIDSC